MEPFNQAVSKSSYFFASVDLFVCLNCWFRQFLFVVFQEIITGSAMFSSCHLTSLQDVGLIIAAAGSASRFGAAGNKLLLPLGSMGLPVFCHCLRNLAPLLSSSRSILVVSREHFAAFQEHLAQTDLAALVTLISGGQRRQDSVLAGLQALPAEVNYVAVQDAARPLTDAQLLQRCVKAARQHGAAIAAARAVDTIKVANEQNIVLSTPDRSRLWAAQTPQVFCKKLLLNALQYCQKEQLAITDDAQALEHCGIPVHLVENKSPNPKITHPIDLILTNQLLAMTDENK